MGSQGHKYYNNITYPAGRVGICWVSIKVGSLLTLSRTQPEARTFDCHGLTTIPWPLYYVVLRSSKVSTLYAPRLGES